jgi:uncharacterized MnhB-related membrane protein
MSAIMEDGLALLAFDLLMLSTLLGLAVATLSSRDPRRAAILFIIFGLWLSLVWARLGAPDVALAEAAIGAGLGGALILAAARRAARSQTPPASEGSDLGFGGRSPAASFSAGGLPPENPADGGEGDSVAPQAGVSGAEPDAADDAHPPLAQASRSESEATLADANASQTETPARQAESASVPAPVMAKDQPAQGELKLPPPETPSVQSRRKRSKAKKPRSNTSPTPPEPMPSGKAPE